MPPGNKSTVGYSSTASSGTTDSIAETFSNSNTSGLDFSLFGFSLGGTVTFSNSSTKTTTDQTTIQNTESTTWSTSGNPIDHTQDILTIWLNPQIIVTNFHFPAGGGPYKLPNGPQIEYSLGNAAYSTAGNGSMVIGPPIPGDDMDNISVSVAALQNPTTLLPSQLVSRTTSDGTTLPGLLILCANRIPESQCTAAVASASACGCTAQDFIKMVNMDPFFDPNIPTKTIDGINTADPDNARFVPVLDVSGGDLMPQIQSNATTTVALTDSYNHSVTYSNTVSNTETISLGYDSKNPAAFFNPTPFDLKDTESMTWSMTKSSGSSNGIAHTQSLTLATTNPQCNEPVNIFEDTLYHTFVFENGSNAANPCPNPIPTVSPASVGLYAGGSQQFTATVPGGVSQTVTWTASAGTISQSGLYKAPASVATQQTVTVTACTEVASPGCGTATVTLLVPPPVISPSSASLSPGGSQNFSVSVPGGGNSAVGSWTYSPQVGTLNVIAPQGQLVQYTAPSLITSTQTVTLKACLASNLSLCSTATVTLIAPPISISPPAAALRAGQSQTFTVIVPGGGNSAANWSYSPTVGNLNYIAPMGQEVIYYAPSSITTVQTITLKACLASNSNLCATVPVALLTR
jgi:hypothetical protein